MSLIRATCDTCGDIELLAGDFTIMECTTNHTYTYLFRCRVCQLIQVKEPPPEVLDVLNKLRVPTRSWELPTRDKISAETPRQPVTHDDILELHEALQNDAAVMSALEALAAATET